VDRDTLVTRSADQASAVIDGEVVAMRFSDGVYLTMDEVGTEVWSLLAEPIAFGELCADLAGRFAVDPAVCEHDVSSFLDGLRAEGLVDVADPG
jgi:hypothetical protein